MDLPAVYAKDKGVVAREIDNEVILLPIYRTSKDIDCIYTLNESAARVWALINGKRPAGSMVKMIVKEYGIKEQEARSKISGLLKELETIKAIRRAAGCAPRRSR